VFTSAGDRPPGATGAAQLTRPAKRRGGSDVKLTVQTIDWSKNSMSVDSS